MARMLDRVREWLGFGVTPLMTGSAAGGVSGGWIFAPPAAGAAPAVTELSALALAPYGRGVDLIATSIAGVELRAYRRDPANMIDVRIEPAPAVLRDPVPAITPWAWRYGAAEDLVQYGNHCSLYGAPNAEGWPTSLIPVDITTVDLGVLPDAYGPRLVWRIADVVYDYGSVFHISSGNRSGKILGRGVLAQYREAVSGVLATDQHARRYFQSGGIPPAIIQSDNPDLTQDQANQYKQRYRDTVGSGSREPLVLPAGVQFTPVVSDAEKQQLVQARQWDAQLVAMMLGIPPYKLGLPTAGMTYSNIEQEDIAFVRDTVSRYSGAIEAAATKWLLPAGQSARFDWSARQRHDQQTRANVMRTEIEAGLMEVNEGRRHLNRPPLATVPAPKPEQPVEVQES